MTIDGSILIGSRAMRRSATFHAANPATGETLPQAYCEATADEVGAACALAEAASPAFAALPPATRAALREAVAEAIVAVGDELMATAMAETGVPRVRL